MKKQLFSFLIIFNFINISLNIYSFDAGCGYIHSPGEEISLTDFTDLYHDSEGGIRHPENKYGVAFFYGPFAPLALGIAVTCDIESKLASKRLEKSICTGTVDEELVSNIRYQRKSHLFTVIEQKNKAALQSLLREEGYKTRLNMNKGKYTPVAKAAIEGWNEGLEVMLESGGSPYTTMKRGSREVTLVRVLAEQKQLVGLGMLLKNSAWMLGEDKAFILSQADEGVFKTVGDNLNGAVYVEREKKLILPVKTTEGY